MEDPQKKSIRLLLLHRLFNERARGYKTSELSEYLGVSERTIERDRLDLEAPPYSLPLEKDGWYWRLDRTRVVPLPPITLTREQAAALYLGARLLMQHSGPLVPLAALAVQRLAEALPVEIGMYLTRTLPVPETDAQNVQQQTVFADLVCGWLERRKVVCRHATLRGPLREYRLAPYSFEPSAIGYAVYVRGQCDTDPAGRLRTLKLERIRGTELTTESFTQGTPDPAGGLEAAWRIWGGDEPPAEVRLRFTARVAPRVRETVWHPSQRLTDLADGGCAWQAWVAEPQEMLPWIRGWGAECEVLAPEKLRNALIREARHLARLYRIAPAKQPPAEALAASSLEDPEAADLARLNHTFTDFFGE